MPDKFAIIRLTLKVDMNDIKEKSFARAMLRRLNVMFAKCRPKGGLIEILNGSKLRDAYEGKQVVEIVKFVKAVDQQPKPASSFVQKSLGYQFVKPTEKPKPETILEHSMQPPEIVREISGG